MAALLIFAAEVTVLRGARRCGDSGAMDAFKTMLFTFP